MLKTANRSSRSSTPAIRSAGSRFTPSSAAPTRSRAIRRNAPARRRSTRSTRLRRRRRRSRRFSDFPPAIPGLPKPCAAASSTSSSASRSKTTVSISRTATARARMRKKTATRNRRRGEVAAGMKAGTLPPFIGIRIKPMSRELHARSLRTLDIFVTTLVKTATRLPANFAVTATKVMTPAHVSVLAQRCSALERKLRLKRQRDSTRVDDRDAAIDPGAGRQRRACPRSSRPAAAACAARTSASTTTPRSAASPRPGSIRGTSPATSAREMMRVSLAQTGVRLSDGSSNLLPIPPHVHDGVEAALRRRDAFARQRVLPGLGSASRRICRRAMRRSTRSICRRVRRRRCA